jgi:hypothetical protein
MYDIAQLNVGRAVAPLDDAAMADVMNWLDEINALAESSPGSYGACRATTATTRA